MALRENNKIYYSYKDVTILPSIISNIEHRSSCNPYYDNGLLPLFTSPMDTVVGEENFSSFYNESIVPILPRTIDVNKRLKNSTDGKWSAYSLSEFERLFCNGLNVIQSDSIFALIDVANGHMSKILDVSRRAKNLYGDKITIMAGNIANPQTYIQYAEAGIDYCRCGIGGGNCCITATQLGIFCPMATLISDIYNIKKFLLSQGKKNLPKIVADGGVRNYDDIIKALALGADYVMCGSIFSKMMESSAHKFFGKDSKVRLRFPIERYKNLKFDGSNWVGNYTDEFLAELESKGVKKDDNAQIVIGKVKSMYYGMASERGQIALNGSKTKTSEGNMKLLDVTYTMHGWSTNFKDYLRSAMSYIGCTRINDIAECSEVIINSKNASESINK